MPTNKTAIFPGRFQPPHLGHVLTLMRIYPLYDKIIIAVSEYTYGGKKKQVVPPEVAKKILEDLFEHLPKFKVVLMRKGFIERTTFNDLPKFDVVVTGNLETIHKMEKLGIKTRYVKRTKGLQGWSGRELREALWP